MALALNLIERLQNMVASGQENCLCGSSWCPTNHDISSTSVSDLVLEITQQYY